MILYIYIYIYRWPTVVDGDPKAPCSIATTLRCRRGKYTFPWIAPLTLDLYLITLIAKQVGIKYHFFSLWYDSTWKRTPISKTIDKHFICCLCKMKYCLHYVSLKLPSNLYLSTYSADTISQSIEFFISQFIIHCLFLLSPLSLSLISWVFVVFLFLPTYHPSPCIRSFLAFLEDLNFQLRKFSRSE